MKQTSDPIEANPVDQRQSLQELVNDIDGGRVEMLVIVGGNPVYNTPADLKLDKDRLFKTKLRVHLSQYKDETSELCHWHIPETHYLEAWSDTRSFDGTVTIVQPLIEPLYQNKSAHELLAVFTPKYDQKPYEIIREYWTTNRQSAVGSRQAAVANQQPVGGSRESSGGATAVARPSPAPVATPAGDFDSWWRQCVHDGFVPNTALATKTATANVESVGQGSC